MQERNVKFTWRVHKTGCTVVKGLVLTDEGDLVSSPRETTIVTEGFQHRQEPRAAYNYFEPLKQYTGLFREFAEMKSSADAIVAFADQYGLLGAESVEVETISNRAKVHGSWSERHVTSGSKKSRP